MTVFTSGDEEILLRELRRLEDAEKNEEEQGFTLPDIIRLARENGGISGDKHTGYQYWKSRVDKLVETGVLERSMVKKPSPWGHKARAYPGYIIAKRDSDDSDMI